MSGVEYLLDTNFILGMLKATPEVTAALATQSITSGQCAYSAVTRMELLGFPAIQPWEEVLIRATLDKLRYLPIDRAVEDRAIQLRRLRRVKLPDALIAATALRHGLQLLTLDAGLQSVMRDAAPLT
jgi:predicted nucleic acid-binding protein